MYFGAWRLQLAEGSEIESLEFSQARPSALKPTRRRLIVRNPRELSAYWVSRRRIYLTEKELSPIVALA
jgi:hypothetical protein